MHNFFVTVLLGRGMIWVGYLFLELHKKTSFLNVSASDLIFTKNLKTFHQELLKLEKIEIVFFFFQMSAVYNWRSVFGRVPPNEPLVAYVSSVCP